ncbi:uncharacterized protein C1orf115 homolog isoform X1 [Sceloporus undulatus]|uniref:uncharacterized protein C1orf115 homolog isoform X1 n=1 Tax=Sceloporus undulatus TaxID=8520 RepID=UPI001C4B837B|nr:uncharacterized protein C1orf115 homolog isoform X1 [Sceloporus undulatus]
MPLAGKLRAPCSCSCSRAEDQLPILEREGGGEGKGPGQARALGASQKGAVGQEEGAQLPRPPEPERKGKKRRRKLRKYGKLLSMPKAAEMTTNWGDECGQGTTKRLPLPGPRPAGISQCLFIPTWSGRFSSDSFPLDLS